MAAAIITRYCRVLQAADSVWLLSVFLQDHQFKCYSTSWEETVSYWTECSAERTIVCCFEEEDVPDDEEEDSAVAASTDSSFADDDGDHEDEDSCDDDLPTKSSSTIRQGTCAAPRSLRSDDIGSTSSTAICVGGFEFEESADAAADDFDKMEYMDDPDEDSDEEDGASDGARDHSDAEDDADEVSPLRSISGPAVRNVPVEDAASPIKAHRRVMSTAHVPVSTSTLTAADLELDCGFEFASDTAEPGSEVSDQEESSDEDEDADEDDEVPATSTAVPAPVAVPTTSVARLR